MPANATCGATEMSKRLHQMLDRALNAPGFKQWRKSRFDADFNRAAYGGICRGVFKTYEEAVKSAPASLPLGYDHEAPAAMYGDRLDRVFPSDYPMMLWLERAFADGASRVFDLGGHVGVSYYAYQKYLAYPNNLAWQVSDVPAVNKVGAEMAFERDSRRQLQFVGSFDLAGDADVLFTSGCLQYLPETLDAKLQSLSKKPRWVLVNLLPLHDRLAYWTVENIGTAFCPYRIQQKSTFFDDLKRLDYDLLDVWENREKGCSVAFSPEHCLDRYFGAALRLGHH